MEKERYPMIRPKHSGTVYSGERRGELDLLMKRCCITRSRWTLFSSEIRLRISGMYKPISDAQRNKSLTGE
jgi:hypothetical protein